MIAPELQRKIELIRLAVGKKVTESFTGNYESAFKGQGIEFNEVKEYVPGDDYRSIDWNVTARTGIPFSKRYTEERELSIVFAVDVSASASFAGRGQTRLEMQAKVVTALALAAARSNDKTGLLLFSDTVTDWLPPSKGKQQTLRLIREVMAARPSNRGTDLTLALNTLSKLTTKRWVVFLISDFYDFNPKWFQVCRLFRRQFDLVPVRPVSQADFTLPNVGLIHVADPETGKRLIIDTSGRGVRRSFLNEQTAFEARLRRELSKAGTPLLRLDMDGDWISQLIAFFARREANRRGMP